jgi:TPR repeat protein
MGGVEERVAGKRPSQEITRDGDGGLWSGVGGKIGKAGEQGHVESQMQVAKLYIDHKHDLSPRDRPPLFDRSRTWPELTAMAEQGDIPSQRALGHLYRFSYNEVAAEKWYMKAAEQGDLDSLVGLSQIARSHKERDEWLLKAAEGGHAASQYQLGRYFKDHNSAMGVSWFGNSWDFGRAKAQAIQWLTKSAEQDHAPAQLELGKYYLGERLLSEATTPP